MVARSFVGTLLLGVVFTCAACGDGDDAPEDGASADAAAESAPSPLTGLPEKRSALRRYPVLVVKIDNTASSAPQQGLSSADLVVEELVEGGVTRLATFFYSDIPDTVGPVRSMRASDIGIVAPAEATIVTSGAASVTISRIRRAGIGFVGEGSAGFFRDSGRPTPYNLMTDLGDLADSLKGKARRADDYLTFGTSADLPKGQPANQVSVRFSQAHTTAWSYRNRHYTNTNTLAAAGDEFSADTVLVLQVKVVDAGYRDPAGNFVPETVLEGEGPAILFHRGTAVPATWTKQSIDSALELSTLEGGPLAVPAGHTWIELLPADGGALTYGR
ncbi:MAG: DUF3048 domain-containing protein [Nocardioides sp.]